MVQRCATHRWNWENWLKTAFTSSGFLCKSPGSHRKGVCCCSGRPREVQWTPAPLPACSLAREEPTSWQARRNIIAVSGWFADRRAARASVRQPAARKSDIALHKNGAARGSRNQGYQSDGSVHYRPVASASSRSQPLVANDPLQACTVPYPMHSLAPAQCGELFWTGILVPPQVLFLHQCVASPLAQHPANSSGFMVPHSMTSRVPSAQPQPQPQPTPESRRHRTESIRGGYVEGPKRRREQHGELLVKQRRGISVPLRRVPVSSE